VFLLVVSAIHITAPVIGLGNLDQRRAGIRTELEEAPVASLDFELLKKMAADAL